MNATVAWPSRVGGVRYRVRRAVVALVEEHRDARLAEAQRAAAEAQRAYADAVAAMVTARARVDESRAVVARLDRFLEAAYRVKQGALRGLTAPNGEPYPWQTIADVLAADARCALWSGSWSRSRR